MLRGKAQARAKHAVAPGTELFRHEVRRDGRPVVTLRGVQATDGISVEAEIYPATDPPAPDPLLRPFHFASSEHASRFADEALVALEYLGCSVSPRLPARGSG